MKKILAVIPCFSMILFCTGILSSCKPDAPSVLKIFIRSANNELLEGAEVVIIGDPKSNPPTGAYVDTLLTNSSGYAEFNLEPYFSGSGTGNFIAYFDVIAKNNLKNTTAYVRCRKNITSVETMYLMN
jgi:hypothetical protein